MIIVRFLLKISAGIDFLNEWVGKIVRWGVLVSVLVSAVNATVRYSLDTSSNAWLELQWYLFAGVFLLCSGYTLLRNEHVRIDILAGRAGKRYQTWIDIIGGLFFLMPMAYLILKFSIPMVIDSYHHQETSDAAGGLLRWPVKILIPIGFSLLILQAFSEVTKRIGFLLGQCPDPVARFHSHGSHPDEEEIEEEVAEVKGEAPK